METPAAPNPMAIKKMTDHIKKIEAEKAKEMDKLVEDLHKKVFKKDEMTVSEVRRVETEDHKTSQRENRKRAQELKKKGMSNVQIAETMRMSESTIRNLLKPYEPKPHLTQRIEGLEKLKNQRENSRRNHPAGRGRNGGK